MLVKQERHTGREGNEGSPEEDVDRDKGRWEGGKGKWEGQAGREVGEKERWEREMGKMVRKGCEQKR